MVLFGYDQGVMSGLITAPGFKQEIFGTQTPASGISGCVVAIYEIGAFVGALGVIGFGRVQDTGNKTLRYADIVHRSSNWT